MPEMEFVWHFNDFLGLGNAEFDIFFSFYFDLKKLQKTTLTLIVDFSKISSKFLDFGHYNKRNTLANDINPILK